MGKIGVRHSRVTDSTVLRLQNRALTDDGRSRWCSQGHVVRKGNGRRDWIAELHDDLGVPRKAKRKSKVETQSKGPIKVVSQRVDVGKGRGGRAATRKGKKVSMDPWSDETPQNWGM